MRKFKFVWVSTLAVTATFLTGCLALAPVKGGSEFGNRIDGTTQDGRKTIVITLADDATDYRFFDAVYESVTIRPAAPRRGGVPVEVLIKGSFPDSCSDLHSVDQQRAGNLLLVTLTMRRPQSAVCASVLRPYRFYLDLDGVFLPGSYSLKLNEESHPFVVR